MHFLWMVTGLAMVFLIGCDYTSEADTFDVTATLSDTTCGTGALDAEETWEFQIKMQRDGDALVIEDIENAIQMEGSIEDEEFTLSTSDTFVVTEGTSDSAGCSVHRRDQYTGEIESVGNEISRVEGEILYTFSQATGYDCEVLVGATNGFDDLPCKIEYTFVATPAD